MSKELSEKNGSSKGEKSREDIKKSKASKDNNASLKKEPEKVIQVINVKKIYHMGKERICAVNGVSFDILKGEFCCLLGTSGSGKSTLLNLMAGIEKTTSGEIVIKGRKIHRMSENKLAKFRQRYLGFIFQSYNLLNSMTALENVEFPLVFKRVPAKKRRKLAADMLIKVGLKSRLKHKPKEMSGGQQQRVGIARAFVARPEIIFADEPTGNLDTKTTMEVMDLMKAMAKENNQTIVMVTHDPRLASYADKIIHILDGNIQDIEIIDHSKDAEEKDVDKTRTQSAEGTDGSKLNEDNKQELEKADMEAASDAAAAESMQVSSENKETEKGSDITAKDDRNKEDEGESAKASGKLTREEAVRQAENAKH